MKALSSQPLKKRAFQKLTETPLIFTSSDPIVFTEYVGVLWLFGGGAEGGKWG